MTTVMELEKLKKRLADNKEEQNHIDKVIQEIKDEGWDDLTPSERAFVHRIEDKCKGCGNKHDNCSCNNELEEPTEDTNFAKKEEVEPAWYEEPKGNFTWEDIKEEWPGTYAKDDGIGDAANHLMYDRPKHSYDQGYGDDDPNGHDFSLKLVNPENIDYAKHGPEDHRVRRAKSGYEDYSIFDPTMPPPVLVERHGVYQVADGHHRSEAAHSLGVKKLWAYVAKSPHEDVSFADGEKAPFHKAKLIPKEKDTKVDFDLKSTNKRISQLKNNFEGIDTATELRRDLVRDLRLASEQALIETFGSNAPKDAKALVRNFLREQRAYAYNYAAEAKDSGVQPSRTKLYASALHGLYQSLKRLKATQSGAQWERRVLGPAEESCSTCKKLANKGWAKLNSLPKIGDSPCKANCRCRFEFSVQDAKPSR